MFIYTYMLNCVEVCAKKKVLFTAAFLIFNNLEKSQQALREQFRVFRDTWKIWTATDAQFNHFFCIEHLMKSNSSLLTYEKSLSAFAFTSGSSMFSIKSLALANM